MKLWTLTWSPEGKPLGNVRAETAQEAICMAPKPYRQYPGEVYAEEVPQLLSIGGLVCLPNGEVLFRVYREGDCDTINAADPNLDNLGVALYDERERGYLPPNCHEVLLPGGKLFSF